jgi:zinc protease
LKDIESYTIDDVKNFFKDHYSPDNASLVIAGDFDEKTAIDFIKKYFGSIPASGFNFTPESKHITLNQNIFIEHKDNVQLERLYLAWPSDHIFGEYDAELEVTADILSGSKNSRLYKKLVFDLQIAQDITAFQHSGKFGGQFLIIATAKPGIKLSRIKNIILDEINLISKKHIDEKELQKSKNGIKAQFVYAMQNLDTIADYLNYYNFHLNEPSSFNFDLTRYNNVSRESIRNAVTNFLIKPFVELHITPKA